MSRNSLYFIRPDWIGERENSHEAVVKTFYGHGPRDISVGVELWRLTGNEDGARELQKLFDRAYDRDDVLLDLTDMAQMIDNIDRLETELGKTIMDSRGIVAEDQLAELRPQAELVQIGEELGDLAKYGVIEALSKVRALRNLLREALDKGLHVALDYS